MRLLLSGVRLLGLEKSDVVIDRGKIVEISTKISDGKVDKKFDLDGAVLLPSLLDLHTHTRQPGNDYEETVVSFSKAAVHGGVTAACSMPNTDPVVDNKGLVGWLKKEFSKVGLIDVYPVASITVGQKGEKLVEMYALKQAGAIAVSEDGLSVRNAALMRHAMEYAKTIGLLVMLHCEDANLRGLGSMNEGSVSLKLGLRGIPEVAETIGILRDLELAVYTQTKVHISHVSLIRSLRMISIYKKYYPGLITCETAPHYLIFSEDDVSSYSTNFKMNPPLRTERDRKGLVRALRRNMIDCIATDHAPHADWEKELEFELAPFGVIGMETWLPSLVHYFLRKGMLSWLEIKKLCSDNPRRIIGLKPVELVVGEEADLVVIDERVSWKVSRETLYSNSKNSPFLGKELYGKVLLTLKSGKVVYQDI